MKCPKCDVLLEQTAEHGIEVDRCPACNGIWFDFGELEGVLGAEDLVVLKERVEASAAMDAAEGACPRCKGEGHMVPVKQLGKNFHIDTCTVCYGNWLDGGELECLRAQGFAVDLRAFLAEVFGHPES